MIFYVWWSLIQAENALVEFGPALFFCGFVFLYQWFDFLLQLNADFEMSVESIRKKLNVVVVPIQVGFSIA